MSKEYYTIKDISKKHLISTRTVESNIALMKSQLTSDAMLMEDNKWYFKEEFIPQLIIRKYMKYLSKISQVTEAISMFKEFESELTMFGTIAPKKVTEMPKLINTIKQVVKLLPSPTKLLFAIEKNSNELLNDGYHLHFVTDVQLDNQFDVQPIKNIITKVLELHYEKKQLCFNTVDLAPYFMGTGNGGLNYILKYYNTEQGYKYGILAK